MHWRRGRLYQPGSLILLLSPSLRQSQELFRKVKAFYHATPHRPAVEQESALQMELVNGSRIVALPGKEETIRGYSGVALLVVDEAARVHDNLHKAVRPMLAVSGGRIVMLSTPYGKRGAFYTAWSEGEGWHRVKVTADQCLRLPQATLDAVLAEMGERDFNQEYMCVFTETVDQVFGFDIVHEAKSAEVKPLFPGAPWARRDPELMDESTYVVRVDLAQSHDFTALCVHRGLAAEAL